MKGKLCGLLLVSVITFGLSLSVFSDVSAKRYTIDSFLAHGVSVAPNFGGVPSPDITFINSFDMNSIDPRNTSYLSTKFNSTSGKCVYNNYVNPGYTISGQTVSWGGSFYPSFSTFDSSIPLPQSYPNVSGSPDYQCRNTLSYGSHNDIFDFDVPEYDDSSTPFDKSINVSSMLPYNYMFNVLYFNGSRTVDGIEYSSKFDISEMINPLHSDTNSDSITYYSDSISSATFPLNFDSSVESLDLTKDISLIGSLNISDLSSSDLSHLKIGLVLRYGGNITPIQNCSTSYSSSLLSFNCLINPQQINSSASYVLGPARYYFQFIIRSDNVSTTPLSSSPLAITFNNFEITLNEDSIFAGYGGFSQTGSYPNVAPGIPDVDPSSADWQSSILNMFNFNFINPFQPIFSMFSPDNNCASIPTLAGMLHSEETTVCPFFSSETRSILTPVFTLSSMMIIFGFTVRWLGSRSGNMVEDDFSADVGGFNVGTKRRTK